MRLLLDTHIAVWALTDDRRLSTEARRLLLDEESELFVSAASVWEIAIKHALGRRRMPISGAEALGHFRDAGYAILAVRGEHAAAVERLPALHSDPFDRLLVAQAQTEPLRLITHDAMLAGYGAAVLLV